MPPLLYHWIPKECLESDDGQISLATLPRPFSLLRFFVIGQVPAGATRGRHAHKQCSQILSCLTGRIEVLLDDGRTRETVELTPDSRALLIPPLVWSAQTYQEQESRLLVLADAPYDENEYLRDYDEFLKQVKG